VLKGLSYKDAETKTPLTSEFPGCFELSPAEPGIAASDDIDLTWPKKELVLKNSANCVLTTASAGQTRFNHNG
jgi:hypothetical protein